MHCYPWLVVSNGVPLISLQELSVWRVSWLQSVHCLPKLVLPGRVISSRLPVRGSLLYKVFQVLWSVCIFIIGLSHHFKPITGFLFGLVTLDHHFATSLSNNQKIVMTILLPAGGHRLTLPTFPATGESIHVARCSRTGRLQVDSSRLQTYQVATLDLRRTTQPPPVSSIIVTQARVLNGLWFQSMPIRQVTKRLHPSDID